MRNWREPVTFTLSPEGQVTSWSEGVQAVLGYSAKEFLGKHFEVLFTVDDISGGVPERLLRTAMELGSAPLAGWRLDKDGVRRFARGELTALQGLDREIVGLAVTFLPTNVGPNSSDRRREPRVPQGDEHLDPATLAELLTGINERFFVLDDEFNFVYLNEVAASVWGKASDELLGRPILEVLPNLQDTQLLVEALRVANEGEARRFVTYSPLTGSQVEVSIYPNPFGGVAVILRDGHDRAEHGQTNLSDERLAEAYAALEISVIEWEPLGGAWQEAGTTADIFGLPPGGRLGSRDEQLALVLPADLERYRRLVERAVSEGEAWRTEYRIVRPVDSEVAWLEESSSVLAGDGPTRYSVLAWDVTPTKLAEESLRSSQRRLQQELASNRRLQEVLSRTARADDTRVALEEVLAGAVELFAAHRATLRVLSREEGILRIVAQRWFDAEYLEKNAEFAVDQELLDRRFSGNPPSQDEGADGSGRFARDVLQDGAYLERWVPLFGLNGLVVGVMVLHWSRPWSFGDRDEHDLVVLARQAAGLVEAFLRDQRTHELEQDLQTRITKYGAELIESEIRFRRAFEAGLTASCITTVEEDRFVEVNGGYMKLTGYDRDEVVGKTSRELGMWSSGEDQAKLEAAFAAGGAFHELQLKLRTEDGHIRDILLTGQQITYEGEPCWLKMFNDVTEQHRSQEELMTAIREVMNDAAWFGQSVVKKLAELRGGPRPEEGEFDLTARERQVLELVAAGLDDTEIAENLGISQKTVRNHLSNTYAKTGVHSRAEAIVWARDRGMVARV